MKRKLNENNVPEAVEKQSAATAGFGNFGLDPRLLQAVNREKFAAPTHIQQKAIPIALQGKDILGTAFIRWWYALSLTLSSSRKDRLRQDARLLATHPARHSRPQSILEAHKALLRDRPHTY